MDVGSADELRSQIKHFLHEFKELVYEDQFHIKNNEKNRSALFELGLTYKLRTEEIISLSVEDYYGGPKPDEYRPGDDYWEFGKRINGVEVYIKLKIQNDWAVCLSFHRAEYPIKYPFK